MESFTRYLERYGKDSQNAALLYTIGRNLIHDNARKQKRKSKLQLDRGNPVDDHKHNLMVREQYRQVLSAMQSLEIDIIFPSAGAQRTIVDGTQICYLSTWGQAGRNHGQLYRLAHIADE